MLSLRVLKDGVEVQNISLEEKGKPNLSLGRAPGSDIRLDDRAVGREHALFVINGSGVAVQKKSKFGKLSVNGRETTETQLKIGDVIDIADYQVRVEGAKQAIQDSVSESHLENNPGTNADSNPDIGLDLPPELTVHGSENNSGESSAAAPLMELQDQNPEANAINPTDPNEFNENERTSMVSTNQITAKLEFLAGAANVEELVIDRPEVTVGRGADCDVVLNDKKASRKHLVIKRVGVGFVAQDQSSANGTYINGTKISEQELAGDDIIRIGETEFIFKAISDEYFNKQSEYISVPAELPQETPVTDPNIPAQMQGDFGALPLASQDLGQAVTGSIPGLSSGPKKKQSLVEKFKEQPLPRKIMIVVGIVVLVAFLMDDGEEKKKANPKPKPSAAALSADANFNALAPEKKQFVINTYELAFELYKNKEFEKAVYEVDKLLQVLPGGYKEAKEIKSFALKSIELLKTQEEEKRRKEAEERLRVEVAELVKRAQSLVDEGKEKEAKDVFAQVLEKDPDNPTILRLRQQLEEKEAQRRADEEAAREADFKRKQLQNVIREARDLYKAGKYYDVLAKLEDAPIIFSTDPKLLGEAKALMLEAKNTLREKTRPHLEVARKAMDDNNLLVARDAFYKALKVDYKNVEAKNGIKKIRVVLHERAQKIYTEALIAEGVSDFTVARSKFKECFAQAMQDDIYYGRCYRKMKRFEILDRGTASEAPALSPTSGGAGGAGGDPEKPQLPNAPDFMKGEGE